MFGFSLENAAQKVGTYFRRQQTSLALRAVVSIAALLILSRFLPGAGVLGQPAGNDVQVSASNSLGVSVAHDLPHTETITLTVRNGQEAGDVHVSVSLIGAAVCDPRLEPEAGDGDTTVDVLMGPTVLAGLQATRLDFFELGMTQGEVREVFRDYALKCPEGGPYTLQIVANVDSELPDPDILNNQDENHPTVTVCCPDVDGDGALNASDVCPFAADPDQFDSDGDGEGDACDPDDDNDGAADALEAPCGSSSLSASSLPGRTDTADDDDGDTQVNEALPPKAEGHDCDGDGFAGTIERIVTTSDQDPCGSGAWPADLAGDDNRLDIADISSFMFPLRGDGSFSQFGHSVPDQQDPIITRWDLDPNGVISVADINALNPVVESPTSHPRMLNGLPALFTNGGQCPFPP